MSYTNTLFAAWIIGGAWFGALLFVIEDYIVQREAAGIAPNVF